MPLSSIIDSPDFEAKKVSLRLTLFLIVFTAVSVFAVAEVYFQFQDVRKDIKVLKERIEYERERVDRKFKNFEQ